MMKKNSSLSLAVIANLAAMAAFSAKAVGTPLASLSKSMQRRLTAGQANRSYWSGENRVGYRGYSRSKYTPHQGNKERERRRKQMKVGEFAL